jgi:hypothetical protein
LEGFYYSYSGSNYYLSCVVWLRYLKKLLFYPSSGAFGGDKMAKGKPKKDSSGRGVRVNKGRGGCKTTKKVGEGRKTSPHGRRRNR